MVLCVVLCIVFVLLIVLWMLICGVNMAVKRILIVTGIILVYMLCASMWIFNTDYYEILQDRHDVKVEEYSQVNHELVNYFQGKGEMPEIFNEKESIHMKDVKDLIIGGSNVFVVLLLLWVIIFLYYGDWEIIRSIGLGVAMLPLLLLFIPYNFIFSLFHMMFFETGSWLFESGSTILLLYPYGFFYDFFFRIVVMSVVIGILLFSSKKVVNLMFSKS